MKRTFYSIAFLMILALALAVGSCQKENANPVTTRINIKNAGFEDSLRYWKTETAYVGIYGFQSSPDAVRSGEFGLNFYAAQSSHYPGAPQETPWNGKIYQEVSGLKNGTYTFKVYADAAGTGMYLWANGGGADVKVKIKSGLNEINTIDFEVTNGIAKFGFICIDANGNEMMLPPYFHADDAELWTKGL